MMQKIVVILGLLVFVLISSVVYFRVAMVGQNKGDGFSFGPIFKETKQAPSFTKEQFSSLENTDRIFSNNHEWVATLSGEKVITIITTGDVIPARMVNYKAMEVYRDPLWPWKKVAETLSRADITYINLEAPLLHNCQSKREGMIFCGKDEMVKGLVFAGVDVANIANNHMGNYGIDGINETKKILANNKILSAGIFGPSYLTVKGVSFAFLGYNDIPGSQPIDNEVNIDQMVGEIKAARKQSDIVVVQLHFGNEYIREPEERQRYLAKIAIDNGADLIIGNHPHWIKPIEFYKGKLITYGHGNFIFDQEWSEETKLGVVGKYVFYDKRLIDVKYLPIRIVDFGQPYFLEGEEKWKVLDKLKPKE